jgi:LacI family transcriptional regulator
MKDISLREIAEEAKVSVALASLVLNNKPTRVSEATRQRVLEVARRNNYVPNKLASALKSKKTDIIAIVAPFTPVGFFSELIYYIEQTAMQQGYSAIVINTFNDEQKERDSLQLYRSGLFDGMLIASLANTPGHSIYAAMQESSFPFVFVDRFAEGVKAPVVSSDHFQVAFDMTSRTIRSGRRNILFLNRTGQAENSTSKARREGYTAAMREAGLDPWEESFTLLGGEHDAQADIGEVLAKLEEPPQAIFLYSGFYMPYLIKAFGDSRFCDSQPQFLTVDGFSFTQDLLTHKYLLEHAVGHFLITLQDIKRIAQVAVDTLISIIEKRSDQGLTIPYIPTTNVWG